MDRSISDILCLWESAYEIYDRVGDVGNADFVSHYCPISAFHYAVVNLCAFPVYALSYMCLFCMILCLCFYIIFS